MFRSTSTISDNLKTWGKQQTKLPPNTENKKTIVLRALRNKTAVSVQKPRRFLPLIFAATGTFLVIIFVSRFVAINMQPAMNSSSGLASETITNIVADNERIHLKNPLSDSTSGAGNTVDCSNEDPFCFKHANPTKLGDAEYEMLQKTLKPIASGIEEISNRFSQKKNSAINDTREFLKTNYRASIKARQVEQTTNRLQTIIRGYGGRIDHVSSDPTYGYISFVIPKTSLNEFSLEIKQLIRTKFLTERMQAENLLLEKQRIEEQTAYTTQSLTDLQTQRQARVEQHTKQVTELQAQMKKYSNSMYALQHETTSSTERQAEIKQQLAYYNNQYYKLQQSLNHENIAYTNELQTFDNQITFAQSQLTNLDIQDQDLLADVETVEGTIDLRWISILDSISLYVPIYWILTLGGISIIVYYLTLGRRRKFNLP